SLDISARPGETAAHRGVTAAGWRVRKLVGSRGGSRRPVSARTRWLEVSMGSYEGTISVLEAELAAVERVFAGLSDDEWRLSTKLVPVEPDLPHWTVFELAGHFDISIGLTRMLIAGRDASRPARDRTSFFINPRSETAPV